MKLAISNIAWDKSDDIKIAELLIASGFNAIEMAPTKVWDDIEKINEKEVIKIKQFWKNYGIKIVAFQSLLYGKNNFNIFNKNQHKEILDYLDKVLIIGRLLGIKVVVFGSPKNRLKGDLSHKEVFSLASKFFYNFAELGRKNNIKIAIEPNPPLYGADFLINTDEVVAFIKKINHPYLGINLDSGILTINKENLENSIKKAFPYLFHFHISEKYLETITSNKENHIQIAKILKDLKYSHYCSIEMKSQKNKELNFKNIKSSLIFVKKIYGD